MVNPELRCAGQECTERDQCLRYLLPTQGARTNWASFDIERLVFGSCQSKITPQFKETQ